MLNYFFIFRQDSLHFHSIMNPIDYESISLTWANHLTVSVCFSENLIFHITFITLFWVSFVKKQRLRFPTRIFKFFFSMRLKKNILVLTFLFATEKSPNVLYQTVNLGEITFVLRNESYFFWLHNSYLKKSILKTEFLCRHFSRFLSTF